MRDWKCPWCFTKKEKIAYVVFVLVIETKERTPHSRH